MVHLIENLAPLLLIVEKALLALLVFLEACIIGIFVWRLRGYAVAGSDADKWMKALTQGLVSPSGPKLDVNEKDAATVSGRVVKTGLANFALAPEALEKVFEAQESVEKRELEKGVAFLGTVGANAPFLGLTGTVLGILVAFDRFAASGGRGSSEVMVAISQSLIATALGLLVAIPAVVFYNILRNRGKTILDRSREIRALIMAWSLNSSLNRVDA